MNSVSRQGPAGAVVHGLGAGPGDGPPGRGDVSVRRTAEEAATAAQGLDDLERTVRCSCGDLSARDHPWQVVPSGASQAVEVARLIGAPARGGGGAGRWRGRAWLHPA